MDRRRCGDTSGEMNVYASLFKEHHITGKQLLLLEEEDLKDMGIVSRGHIIHLKDSAGGTEESIEKVVNLELVFGYHLKPGSGPKDCKWKMYMEMDGDEIAITYIKDVTFNTNLPDAEILKMTKSDVRAPKSTRHIQAICWSKVKAQDEVEAVQLLIQTSLPNSEGNSRSRSDSGYLSLFPLPVDLLLSPYFDQQFPTHTHTTLSPSLPNFLLLESSCTLWKSSLKICQLYYTPLSPGDPVHYVLEELEFCFPKIHEPNFT
ncbi:hypothetical protein DUI87_04435 [Hirundo rustica rustica]|uniref:SAM domain-containing protein n=1 Tax=Hirundo rustica rustica TaxID=333673 RepID=A0A3M0KZG9_HIRRU|nr:hypothetical protein DUI87_04435 [Hirundo rustica rustica]